MSIELGVTVMKNIYQEGKETLDLDQTTMIGSALDLDSLEGDSKQNNAAQVTFIITFF